MTTQDDRTISVVEHLPPDDVSVWLIRVNGVTTRSFEGPRSKALLIAATMAGDPGAETVKIVDTFGGPSIVLYQPST